MSWAGAGRASSARFDVACACRSARPSTALIRPRTARPPDLNANVTCFQAGTYYPTQTCKLSTNISVCAQSWGAWPTMEACCAPGRAFEDGCTKPEPCWIASAWYPSRQCALTEDQARGVVDGGLVRTRSGGNLCTLSHMLLHILLLPTSHSPAPLPSLTHPVRACRPCASAGGARSTRTTHAASPAPPTARGAAPTRRCPLSRDRASCVRAHTLCCTHSTPPDSLSLSLPAAHTLP